MDQSEARQRLRQSRVGRLATIRPDGAPHIVPITFGVVDDHIVTMVDHKPKTTGRLQRLTNVEANGIAALLVDQYDNEWTDLWWVRIDGAAHVHRDGIIWESAVDVLREKYHQYQAKPPRGAAISISIDKISYWSNTP